MERLTVKIYTSAQAQEALGIKQKSLSYLARQGVAKGVLGARGRGHHMAFTLRQIWALGIGRAVRDAGQGLDAAMEAARLIETWDDDYIEQSFAAGRSCLLIVCGMCFPHLVARDATKNNQYVDAAIAEAAAAGATVWHIVLPVEPMWQQLQEWAAKVDGGKTPDKTTTDKHVERWGKLAREVATDGTTD